MYHIISSCTIVLVLGCYWPHLAIVNRMNKLIKRNYY